GGLCVRSEGGSPDGWWKVRRRPEDVKDPVAVEYYRRLSRTEQTAHNLPMGSGITPYSLEARRWVAVEGDKDRKLPPIPMHYELPTELQRRVPDERGREHATPAYIRFIGRHAPNPEHIRAIKMYRVEHRILTPEDGAHGASPYDQRRYLPYYFGEFSPDGRLKDPADPLLYWLIPVVREPKRGVGPLTGSAAWDPDNYVYTDYLTIHAGSYHGGF